MLREMKWTRYTKRRGLIAQADEGLVAFAHLDDLVATGPCASRCTC
jgi:hypothetical protein